jgi:hypothetical protein
LLIVPIIKSIMTVFLFLLVITKTLSTFYYFLSQYVNELFSSE